MEIAESVRMNELFDSRLLESTNSEVFKDDLLYLKDFYGFDAGFVSFVTTERSYINSSFGFGFKSGANEIRSKAFCSITIEQSDFLEIIEPKTKKELSDFSMFDIHSKVQYVLAFPLRTAIGAVVGTLTLVRFTPVELLEKEKRGVDLIKKHLEDKIALFQSVRFKKEIEAQKLEIELKNKEIEASLNYARGLQLTANKELKSFKTPKHNVFIYNRPKDIVSGDFSFYHEKDNVIYLAAADCTGHGLPGALLTVMCSSILNEIVSNASVDIPVGQLLDEVNTQMKHWMTFNEVHRADGMDISILKADSSNKTIQFAGANSSVYIFEGEHTEVIKMDRIPIGNYQTNQNFKTFERRLNENTNVYLYSDGIRDQFGGEKSKKLGRRRFNELLNRLKQIGVGLFDKKENLLNQTLSDWMNEEEQVDDMLLIEIEF